MKKAIVFCLFCAIFTLISASVCFAQDWGGAGFDDFYSFDDFDAEDSEPTPEPSFNDSSTDSFAAEPAAPASDNSEAVAAAKASAAAAAASAAAAAETAAAAAESAAAAAAAAESVSAAASANAPQFTSQQPPVRIVIPMLANPSAQYASPPPAYRPPSPAYNPPPPAYTPPPPPAYQPPPAPPTYRQPPITIIPAMPSPYSASLYRVQLGAFSNNGLAQLCFSRLLAAGFSPAYEPYNNVTRVVLPGLTAADMPLIVQRLAAAGFNEAWIREEK